MGFSFFGLFGQTNKFKTVDVAEFAKAVADTSYVVLDVRTQAEHAEGHIPGTHFNIDVLEDSYTETALKTLPKDKPVALYCRSGNRSKNAARILAEKGYELRSCCGCHYGSRGLPACLSGVYREQFQYSHPPGHLY